MGSCYSCKSGGRTHTYTTVGMANTSEKTTGTTTEQHVIKRTTPYTRTTSNSGIPTFGLKRRAPNTLKSLSQERTSEMVLNYENKIANINTSPPSPPSPSTPSSQTLVKSSSINLTANNKLNSSSTNRTLHNHTNIPRFGSFKSYSGGDSNLVHTASSNNAASLITNQDDANSNSVVTTVSAEVHHHATNNATALANVTATVVNGAKASSQKRGGGGHREKSPEINSIRKNNQNGYGRREEMAKANPKIGGNNRQDRTTPPPRGNSAKVTTHVSGLPRLQVPVVVAAKHISSQKDGRKPAATAAPMAKFDEIEAMQLSSDTLPEEDNDARLDRDSGLGISVSDRGDPKDGDSETLAEVSELARDSPFSEERSSAERTPERASPARSDVGGTSYNRVKSAPVHKSSTPPRTNATTAVKHDKFQTNNSLLYRPKSLSVSSKVALTAPKLGGFKANEWNRNTKYDDSSAVGRRNSKTGLATKKAEDAVDGKTKTQPPRKEPLELARKDSGGSINAGGMRRLTLESRKPASNKSTKDQVGSNSNVNLPPAAGQRPTRNSERAMSSSTGSDGGRSNSSVSDTTLVEKKNASTEMSTSMDSSSASQHDSMQDAGPFSPPSERDQFLIDDEIADQPELIAVQQHELHQRELQQRLLHQDPFGLEHDSYIEEDGSEGMALLHSCTSLESLSTTSSVNSEDLMLDFEQEAALLDSCRSRPGEELYDPDGRETTSAKSRLRSRSLKLQDSKADILDEWTNLLDSHSSLSGGGGGGMRVRRARAASTTDVPSPSASDSPRILRPPKQMTAADADDDGFRIDPASYLLMAQDITNLKTMLFKLKRVIQDNNGTETLNPFEIQSSKNGLLHNLAHNDPPQGCDESDGADQAPKQEDIRQQNTDLRRQVVFLQQQLEERDHTIRLLQTQMTKYTSVPAATVSTKEQSNAATQTDKPRLSLTSMSQSYDESSGGTTVSSSSSQAQDDSFDRNVKVSGRTPQLASDHVTRSLTSLTHHETTSLSLVGPSSRCPSLLDNQPLLLPERSASAVELSRQPVAKATSTANASKKGCKPVETAPPSSAAAGHPRTVGGESLPVAATSSSVTRTTSLRLASRLPSFRRTTAAGNERPKTTTTTTTGPTKKGGATTKR